MSERAALAAPALPPTADELAAPISPEDFALLRRHEPIVRFTQGEEFFPVAIESYLSECSLWFHHPDGSDELLIPQGQVSLDRLAAPRRAEFGAVQFLKFIEPLNIAELTAFLLRSGRRLRDRQVRFRADLGRLARVGYLSRLIDALFTLTMFFRGRVPGDAAAAAALTGRRIRERDSRFPYYGRVVRDCGWTILQYWYFYAFNNWRSGFFGANDHEADWEMINIYLAETEDGEPEPKWIAYASHDFHGDDLRRHWMDREEVTVIDGHPVVYAGAGSHASYFRPGEYLTEIEIDFLKPLLRISETIQRFWVQTLRQAGADVSETRLNIFRIPFVDYARGDGLSIGPGQAQEWTPVVISDELPWVDQYRGLWGLYARDPLSGENAPSGPKYNRDGTVRVAWHDPLGWSGLDKVPPPGTELSILLGRRADLLERQHELEREIEVESARLHGLGVERGALRDHPHLEGAAAKLQNTLETLINHLGLLRQERAENDGLLQAIDRRTAQLQIGAPDDPRAHISRLMKPASEQRLRFNAWVELWAAISIGGLLIGLVLLIVFARQYLLAGLLTMFGAGVLMEAVFRRQVVRLINGITIVLAIIAAIVFIADFFWYIVVLSAVGAGLYLIWDNLRELRSR